MIIVYRKINKIYIANYEKLPFYKYFTEFTLLTIAIVYQRVIIQIIFKITNIITNA